MKLPELRGILQYVTRFRDKVFIIAINGEILESENFPNILLDIAVLRSLNIKVVLVHGAGFQIERAAAQRGTPVSNVDGTGIIDAATLQVSIDVGIRLTNEIMEGLTRVDLRAAYANCIIANQPGNVNEALLAEIFSNGGIGTMIYSNEYEQIRRLYKKDVRAVVSLIQQSIRDDELVRRTRSEILADIDDYWVLEIDRHIVGCVAMYPYPEEKMAKLACLYLSCSRRNQGLGPTLIS